MPETFAINNIYLGLEDFKNYYCNIDDFNCLILYNSNAEFLLHNTEFQLWKVCFDLDSSGLYLSAADTATTAECIF